MEKPRSQSKPFKRVHREELPSKKRVSHWSEDENFLKGLQRPKKKQSAEFWKEFNAMKRETLLRRPEDKSV